MPRRIVVTIFGFLLFVASGPSVAQEHEPDPDGAATEHRNTEGEFHRNHFGGLIGVSTHSDTDDAAFTLGLDYARRFSRRWAISAYVELVSSDIERDVIVALGGVFYVIRGLAVIVAPGVESATREVQVHGQTEQEEELEFLLRVGAAYGFPLTPQAAIGPFVFVDWAGDRWTTLLAVGMVVGF